MAGTTQKKTTTRRRKVPEKKVTAEAVGEAINEEAQGEPIKLVEPLDPQAFQMVMQVIDKADFKGSDMGNVLLLRRELARVSGITPQAPGPRT